MNTKIFSKFAMMAIGLVLCTGFVAYLSMLGTIGLTNLLNIGA